MTKRQIHEADIIHALTHGRVILEEYKQDIVWRVAGRDIDNNKLEVEVVVYEETITIKVITAWKK